MGLNATGLNLMLDALGAVAGYVSAHNADPGTTGLNELSTSPYAREIIAWNSAAAGSLDSNGTPVIDVASGDTVSYLGLWSALSSGTFYGSANVTDEAFGADGTYTVNDFDITIT